MVQTQSETNSSDAQHFIPFSRAYLCQDCDSVGTNSMRCPSCASEALLGLARVFARQEEIKESKLLQFSSLAA